MHLTRTGGIATPATKIGNPMHCTARSGFDSGRVKGTPGRDWLSGSEHADRRVDEPRLRVKLASETLWRACGDLDGRRPAREENRAPCIDERRRAYRVHRVVGHADPSHCHPGSA
jgi:hypothetical protein